MYDEDNTAALQSIEQDWRMNSALDVGYQDPTGKILEAKHLLLQQGDFVDVEVMADIVRTGKGRNGRLRIRFAMSRIIRLQAAARVQVFVFMRGL